MTNSIKIFSWNFLAPSAFLGLTFMGLLAVIYPFSVAGGGEIFAVRFNAYNPPTQEYHVRGRTLECHNTSCTMPLGGSPLEIQLIRANGTITSCTAKHKQVPNISCSATTPPIEYEGPNRELELSGDFRPLENELRQINQVVPLYDWAEDNIILTGHGVAILLGAIIAVWLWFQFLFLKEVTPIPIVMRLIFSVITSMVAYVGLLGLGMISSQVLRQLGYEIHTNMFSFVDQWHTYMPIFYSVAFILQFYRLSLGHPLNHFLRLVYSFGGGIIAAGMLGLYIFLLLLGLVVID